MRGKITWKSEAGDNVTAPVIKCYQDDQHFHIGYQGPGYQGRFALAATWAQQRAFDFFGYGHFDEVAAAEAEVTGCLNRCDGRITFDGTWFDPADDSGQWKVSIELEDAQLAVPGPGPQERAVVDPPTPLYLVEVWENGSMETHYVATTPKHGPLVVTEHISRGLPDGNDYEDLEPEAEQLRLQQVRRSALHLSLADAERMAARAQAEGPSPTCKRFMIINVVHSDGTAKADDVRRRRRVANGE